MQYLKNKSPDTSNQVICSQVLNKQVFEKVVIVTRKTELEELITRFNSIAQAKFYLEHAGQDFIPIEKTHQAYHKVLDNIRRQLPGGLKKQVIERSFLPQFKFGEADLVITIGPDGLVVNTAKYLSKQPILAVNPDPEQIDGVLLPFIPADFNQALEQSLQQSLPVKQVTMAEARLNDGQSLLGFNDLFIGSQSHVSARYELSLGQKSELQSSSGIIVSTGAGSTGWMRSVFAGASAVISALGGEMIPPKNNGQLNWDTDHLMYAVREPFPSKITGTELVFGSISNKQSMTITSYMSENGVIFSDGIESDYLKFNAGSTVSIGISKRKAHILVKH